MADAQFTILVAFDGSDESKGALLEALSLAKEGQKVVSVTVCQQVAVQFPDGQMFGEPITTKKALAEAKLHQAEAQLIFEQNGQKGIEFTAQFLEAVDPREGLIEVAKKEGVNMIVIGSRGRGGLARMLLGSTSDYVVQHAPCQVLVARGSAAKHSGADAESKQVWVVAADGSAESETALTSAGTLLDQQRGDRLEVVVVVSTFLLDTDDVLESDEAASAREKAAARKYVDALSARVKAMGLEHAVTLVDSSADVRDELCRFVKEQKADYLVMGSRGRGGLTRALLGSVSDYCVRNAVCPVMIVRAKEE